MLSLSGNEQDSGSKKFLLIVFSLFFSLSAISVYLINSYYQDTLEKHRRYLQDVFEIKTEIIEMLVNNSSKFGEGQGEKVFLEMLFSHNSMYGLGEFINVIYISRKSGDIFYLFHKENNDVYPTLEIKNYSELDPLSKLVLKKQAGELDSVDFSGEKVFGYHSELANLNWNIVTKIDYKEVQTPFINNILNVLAIIIICFVLSFFIFKRINRFHLSKIKAVAKRSDELISTSGHVIYTLDINNYAPTFVSDNVQNFTGHVVEEIIGNSRFWLEHVHPDDVSKVRKDMSTLYKKGEVVFEYRLEKKDGNHVWIQDTSRLLRNEQGEITEIIGSWVDVTYLKITESKIKEHKDYLENILHNLSSPTFIIDSDHIVLHWNKACEELTGLPAEKVIGTNTQWRGFYRMARPCLADTYIDESEIDELYISIKKTGCNGQFLHAENWCTTYGGRRLYLAIDVAPILDKNGNLVAVVENLQNLTEHRSLETELMDARDKALEAVNAKGRFLANMSHEIRTPMNGVLGMLDLIKTTKLTEEQKDLTETAYYSAEALLNIINEILDFSKIDAGKLKIEILKFNLYKVISDVERLFKIKCKEQCIGFNVTLNENVPEYLFGDPTRLRQILINLLSNACKFTEKGFVNLHINAHKRIADEISIQFDIEDSGIGIPEDAQESLFEEFNQVDASTTRKFGGTGLGLSITKQLLDLMNGRIEVKSQLGQGSRFSVYMTYEVTSSDQKPLPTDNILHLPSRQNIDLKQFSHKKILLVEDNKVNQKVTLGILKKFALSADIAENGEIAVAKVEAGGYHLLLMDCQMPVMNGYDATRLIRQYETTNSKFHVPIIAMTANVMQGDKEKCLAAGMNDYLSKPIDTGLLKEKLFNWLNRNNEVNSMSDKDDIEQKPVLNKDTLLELSSIMEDEFADILRVYLDELVILMSDVHSGFNEQAELLLRSVHTLKSSSNNVGAEKIAIIAKEMEFLVKENNIEDARTHLSALQDAFTETHAEVKKYMESVINDVAV